MVNLGVIKNPKWVNDTQKNTKNSDIKSICNFSSILLHPIILAPKKAVKKHKNWSCEMNFELDDAISKIKSSDIRTRMSESRIGNIVLPLMYHVVDEKRSK